MASVSSQAQLVYASCKKKSGKIPLLSVNYPAHAISMWPSFWQFPHTQAQ